MTLIELIVSLVIAYTLLIGFLYWRGCQIDKEREQFEEKDEHKDNSI